jgi:tetratricopeptide (TPR) repeat protein
MLELRVEQQRDRPAFDAAFQQRLNEAVAGARLRNQEAFVTLQELAEINPAFPGIQGILTQARIDMGLIRPPPNPADLARSLELTRTAEAHYNSRDTTRYGVALAQLDEAIRLNPNNAQAQLLLDQVSMATGAGTMAMPRGVQDQFDLALRLFTQGNFLQANAIVQQLLQSQENQRFALILDLRRRIDAVL